MKMAYYYDENGEMCYYDEDDDYNFSNIPPIEGNPNLPFEKVKAVCEELNWDCYIKDDSIIFRRFLIEYGTNRSFFFQRHPIPLNMFTNGKAEPNFSNLVNYAGYKAQLVESDSWEGLLDCYWCDEHLFRHDTLNAIEHLEPRARAVLDSLKCLEAALAEALEFPEEETE